MAPRRTPAATAPNPISKTSTISDHGFFSQTSLRAVKPRGWISHWLQTQARGLTGNLEVAGFPFDTKLWACDAIPFKHGAPWWPYEQTAYWIDGLTRLGLLLNDPKLKQKASEQIEYVLAHADKQGYLGPKSCKPFMPAGRWSHQIFFRALLAWHGATGDKRIVEALRKHFVGSVFDHSGHRDVCSIEIMCEVYALCGDKRLLDMAIATWERYQKTGEDDDLELRSKQLKKDVPSTSHGVTFCETVKQGAILYRFTGQTRFLADSVNGFVKLDRHHLLPSGAPSSTESLRGTTSRDAHETCDIADYTWSAGHMLMATGQAGYADRIERAIFNAHPGAVTADFKALQYFSSPNQVILGPKSAHTLANAGGHWMCYRPKPGTECCTGEVTRIMPNYVARMWLTHGENPVAALYGPSTYSFTVNKQPVTITQETHYPFGSTIDFCVETAQPVSFILYVRIPQWCDGARIERDGAVIARPKKGGYFPIPGTFANSDRIRVVLPMKVKVCGSVDGGVWVERGPLLYALPIEARRERDKRDRNQSAQFPALNLYPQSEWNYALCLDEKSGDTDVTICHNECTTDPWSQPQLTITVPARKVKKWEVLKCTELPSVGGELIDPAHNKWRVFPSTAHGDFAITPPLPDAATLQKNLAKKVERISLVPYGCTTLRVAVFPRGGSL